MAITKIHPIKSTLNFAIDYITDSHKTDEKVFISTHDCLASCASIQFLKTREDAHAHGDVLTRHLIQSFLPGETTPEKAHEIGLALCEKVLKEEYEFVLSTHVDKGHIHNHIIFNNVNKETGKCYQSNKLSYHRIRTISDTLCRENNLSVIDEFYEAYRRKYKTNGKSWYENEQAKRGKSWKIRLQFDIDRTIKTAKSWDDFLARMASAGYEIKHGKYIAFRHKNKERFTRAKTIGEDYTEERIKERIQNELEKPTFAVKKPIGRIIDASKNEKAKNSPAYANWITKHNLKTMAESVVALRDQGIHSLAQLDALLDKAAAERQSLQEQIRVLEQEMTALPSDMENAHTVQQYRTIYKYHKAKPKGQQLFEEYHSKLVVYTAAAKAILERYAGLPDTKKILSKLDDLAQKKSALMSIYEDNKAHFDELARYRRNYEDGIEKRMER